MGFGIEVLNRLQLLLVRDAREDCSFSIREEGIAVHPERLILLFEVNFKLKFKVLRI